MKFIYVSVNCTTDISFYLEIEPFNQQMLQFQMICVIGANVIELSRFPRMANCALVRNDFSIIYFLITSLYRKSSKGYPCGGNKTASSVIELTCAKTVGRPAFKR